MSNYFDSSSNVLRLSHKILAIGATFLSAGVYGAYFYDAPLAIGTLVSMHAMVILGPTLLKIGYVMRLLAQRRLGSANSNLICALA